MRLQIALLVLLANCALGEPKEVPASIVPQAKAIPDLTQTDSKGKFAGGGRMFCGPVAVSNSLWALYGKDCQLEGLTHYDLVNKLASQQFMNTQPTKGTTVKQLMSGADTYLQGRGEKNYFLKFQGWRVSSQRYQSGVSAPRLQWIKDILSEKRSAVWLNVGWYRHLPDNGPLKRISGHWVTAVGYGKDAKGKLDPHCLIIHDPAPRAGPSRSQYIKLRKIESGVLTGLFTNLPRSARNYYLMEGDMRLKRGADYAVLDGAVGLVLQPVPPVKDPDYSQSSPDLFR